MILLAMIEGFEHLPPTCRISVLQETASLQGGLFF